jgi:tagatose-1,6-bisphosphate aldolase non-catalytic subunit AgaZ/GatZ
MGDQDGPVLTRTIYEALFAKEAIDADVVPYALDRAVRELRNRGVPPERWATFVHMGI